jgi:hypothetical protein
MLRSVVVGKFFKDLVNPDFETAFAIYHRWDLVCAWCDLCVVFCVRVCMCACVHVGVRVCTDRRPCQQRKRAAVVSLWWPEPCAAVRHAPRRCRRFSTNTTPKWPLAQPMRVLGHNGAFAGDAAAGRSPTQPQHACSSRCSRPAGSSSHHSWARCAPRHLQPLTHASHRRHGACAAPRCVCVWHAGEINTLQGNLNWVASRQTELEHPIWAGREEQLLPLCNAAGALRACVFLRRVRCCAAPVLLAWLQVARVCVCVCVCGCVVSGAAHLAWC